LTSCQLEYFVWYTVDIFVTSCDGAIWKTTLNGVYGHCDIYVQLKNSTGFPPILDETHPCTAAEKAGLKPQSTTATPAAVPQQNRIK
jgi:hypothetical protein